MVFCEKYDRWVSKDGLVYRLNKKTGKLVLCKQSKLPKGYTTVGVPTNGGHKSVLVHRVVWEAFNGDIPKGMQIDHINTIRDDNRLENLRVCSQQENSNNPLTKEHIVESNRKKATLRCDFGKRFYEHYGLRWHQDKKLYRDEYHWFCRQGNHKVCQWEVD